MNDVFHDVDQQPEFPLLQLLFQENHILCHCVSEVAVLYTDMHSEAYKVK